MSYSFDLLSHPDRTLETHLNSCETISKSILSQKVFSEIFFSREFIEELRKTLVYYHDFGKGTVYFQWRIIDATQEKNPDFLKDKLPYLDWLKGRFDTVQVRQDMRNDPALGSHALLGALHQFGSKKYSDDSINLVMAEIIRRHHGDLEDFGIEKLTLDEFQQELLKKQTQHHLSELFQKIFDHESIAHSNNWEENLIQLSRPRRVTRVLDQLEKSNDLRYFFLQRLLFSILLSADKGDMMLDDKNLITRPKLIETDLVNQYKKLSFGGNPTKTIDFEREKAFLLVEENLVKHHRSSAFFSITLPTGLGKTLTAYNAAFHLQNILAKQHVIQNQDSIPRIIYCLPFTSIIDQNSMELEKILQLSDAGKVVMTRHHYLSAHNKSYQDNQELSDNEAEYLTEGWEHSIVVTTFVQFLESLFSNKNRKLRKFHNMLNAIFILDEVQSIPPKYFETIEAAFSFLAANFHCKFIFVTATQPILIKNHEVIELTDPTKVATKSFFETKERIELDLSIWKNGKVSDDELFSLFLESIFQESEKSFLFIFNTIKQSQNAYEYFKNFNLEVDLVYLSSNILPSLRAGRISRIKQNTKEKIRQIVISTQVVEAGVDIDLDVVYRDFAPLDSINQSAGRCNRNGIKSKGQVRLFHSGKSNLIYDSTLLNATTHVLNSELENHQNYTIPESAFFRLSTNYSNEVRKRIADDNPNSEMIMLMKTLQNQRLDAKFKLIEDKTNAFDVFIDHSEESNGVWKEYLSILKETDKWEKKRKLKQLKPRLLQHVVRFPKYDFAPPSGSSFGEIVYLPNPSWEAFYSLETGYIKSDLMLISL
jgi:CRISPR-associated endonuclease/helicase Cas3